MSATATLRRRKGTCEPSAAFRALGDPTRIRIVNLLAAGELCVCDLVDLLALPQPTISRHLAVLRASGLVRTRRVGRFCHYRLAEPESTLHATLLETVRRDLDEGPLAAERSEARGRVEQRRRTPC